MAKIIRGTVDLLVNGRISGWVWVVDSEERLTVTVSVNGVDVAQAEANLLRPDLAAAKIGDGHFGYFITVDPQHFVADGENVVRVFVRHDGKEKDLGASPYRITAGEGTGRLDNLIGLFASGWVAPRIPSEQPFCIELLVDGKVRGTAFPSIVRGDLEKYGLAGRPSAVDIRLPSDVLDGDPHEIALRVVGSETLLAGSPKIFQANFEGVIEAAHPSHIVGWAVNHSARGEPVKIDIYANGERVGSAVANVVRSELVERTGSERCGFSVPIPERFRKDGYYTAVAMLAGTQKVLGHPLSWASQEVMARGLMTAAEMLNEIGHAGGPAGLSSSRVVPPEVIGWLRRSLVPELLQQLRKHPPGGFKANIALPPFLKTPYALPDDGVTDVIIPVYRGRAETMACIESVLANTGDARHEVIVVNDCGPEPELAGDLRALAAAGRITLVENEKNLGFVGSVNAGMSLHPQRDVLLLNSDTLVPPGWLSRLRKAAYSAANIGSVTPFSNRATICSFPEMPEDNTLPAGWTLAELDAAFARHNAGVVVDMPTAVGFCMYIRRAALAETGLFDEETWGRGYGEENDFCLRSAAMGWRHVHACDVFVQHHGSVSFAGDKNELASRNLATLIRMYPDYTATVSSYIARDPAAAARRNVLREVFLRESDAHLLFINHTLGGGTQVAVDDLVARLAHEGRRVLMLTLRDRQSPDIWRISRSGENFGLDYRVPEDIPALVGDLRDLGVWHIHYHHLVGFSREILYLPEQTGIGYDFSVHDHLTLCPRINLIDGSGKYCEEPPVAACERCIGDAGVFPGIERIFEPLGGSAASWRAAMTKFLAAARHVITPSDDLGQRMQRHLGLDNILVRPHPETVSVVRMPAHAPLTTRPVNVAVIGAIGDHKGHFTLLACAAEAWRRNLPIRFTVIGYTQDDAAFAKFDNVVITGKYPREQLPALVKTFGCDVALFMSACPETFSYTLGEAWRSGLYPLVPDLGAPAQRVRESGYGEVYSRTLAPTQINELLLQVAQRPIAGTTLNVGTDYSSVVRDYYDFPADAAPALKAKTVCVLGMHRSGTSALAGALIEAGLHAGDVLRFGPDNVKGHMESSTVIGINDAVLRHSGGAWNRPPEKLAWTTGLRRRRDLFVAGMQKSAAPWVFKGPRMLFTLPFWREALPDVQCIGTFRHPLSVAFSLYQRDGLAIEEGLRLWIDYNRKLVECCKNDKMPLLCFDLPERAYLAALAQALKTLGKSLRMTLDAEKARGFFAQELRGSAIPVAVVGTATPTVTLALQALLDEATGIYDWLLDHAGCTRADLVFGTDQLPLRPTVELCEQLLREQPENLFVLTMLARLHEQAANLPALIAVRRKLVALAPDNYLALRALLDALEKSGQMDELIADSEPYLARHNDNPDLHFRLGAAFAAKGARDKAVGHYAVARDAGFLFYEAVARIAALEKA